VYLADGVAKPQALWADGLHVFWATDPGAIVEYTKATATQRTIVTGQTFVTAITADEASLYWARLGVGIFKAAK
jgi:hypothetical protein